MAAQDDGVVTGYGTFIMPAAATYWWTGGTLQGDANEGDALQTGLLQS